MTRRTLLFALATIMLALVTSFTTPVTVHAQQDLNCCTYYIDIDIPTTCFRVQVWTRWSNGIIGPQTFAANGVYSFPIPTPPPCPPAAIFGGASLAGPNGPFATHNNPVQFKVNNCCLVARIAYLNGCPYIYIRPC